MGSRGQIFTWDLIFATGLFIIVLYGVMFIYNSINSGIRDSEIKYDLGRITVSINEQLVRTPGYPMDWNPGNVITFGLAESSDTLGFESAQDRIIDPDKFIQLVNITGADYFKVRGMLLRSGIYDFYIIISCKDQANPRECFTDLYVNGISSAAGADAIVCSESDLRFDIVDNIVTPMGTDDNCIIGQYVGIEDIVYLISDVKNAVFNEPLNLSDVSFSGRSLNKSFDITTVVYRISPYVTTTSTTSTTTTSTSTTSTTSSTTSTSTTSTSTTTTSLISTCAQYCQNIEGYDTGACISPGGSTTTSTTTTTIDFGTPPTGSCDPGEVFIFCERPGDRYCGGGGVCCPDNVGNYALPNRANYCVNPYNEECYYDWRLGIDGGGELEGPGYDIDDDDCIIGGPPSSCADIDGDGDYEICGQGILRLSDQRGTWWDADNATTSCTEVNETLGVITFYDTDWPAGACEKSNCNEEKPTSNEYCCGDDYGEYPIEYGGGGVWGCCDAPDDIVDASGICDFGCQSPPGGVTLVPYDVPQYCTVSCGCNCYDTA